METRFKRNDELRIAGRKTKKKLTSGIERRKEKRVKKTRERPSNWDGNKI